MSDRFTAKISVFLIVRDNVGRVLLQQRSGTGYLNGYWDFPSGHGEYNEALRDSAVRELAEETGLQTHADALRLVHIDQCFDQDPQHCYVNFIFAADAWTGEPRITEPDKCSGMDWFAVEALPENCVNTVRNVEQVGFGDDLTYSVTDSKVFEQMLGMALTDSNN